MSGVIFDTHAHVKRLMEAGFTAEQAEAHVSTLRELIEGQLATKRDLKELETVTRRDLKELEAATKRDLKELEVSLKQDLKNLELTFDMKLTDRVAQAKVEIIRWVAGMLVAQAAVVATLVKLF